MVPNQTQVCNQLLIQYKTSKKQFIYEDIFPKMFCNTGRLLRTLDKYSKKHYDNNMHVPVFDKQVNSKFILIKEKLSSITHIQNEYILIF